MNYSREQYLMGRCTHEQFYSQMVTPALTAQVLEFWGIRRLLPAYKDDPVFNNLPLGDWDRLARQIACEDTKWEFREAGDWETLGGLVCLAKQAAREACETALKADQANQADQAPESVQAPEKITLGEAVDFLAGAGINVLVIDENTDFKTLPPFASLFPDLGAPAPLKAEPPVTHSVTEQRDTALLHLDRCINALLDCPSLPKASLAILRDATGWLTRLRAEKAKGGTE